MDDVREGAEVKYIHAFASDGGGGDEITSGTITITKITDQGITLKFDDVHFTNEIEDGKRANYSLNGTLEFVGHYPNGGKDYPGSLVKDGKKYKVEKAERLRGEDEKVTFVSEEDPTVKETVYFDYDNIINKEKGHVGLAMNSMDNTITSGAGTLVDTQMTEGDFGTILSTTVVFEKLTFTINGSTYVIDGTIKFDYQQAE